jgi:DNA-binding Xre family transcriptional regulator
MITYEKLWKRMKEQGITQYRLHIEGISNSTLTRLKRNKSVNMETIDKLCSILQCDVGDIMEYKQE